MYKICVYSVLYRMYRFIQKLIKFPAQFCFLQSQFCFLHGITALVFWEFFCAASIAVPDFCGNFPGQSSLLYQIFSAFFRLLCASFSLLFPAFIAKSTFVSSLNCWCNSQPSLLIFFFCGLHSHYFLISFILYCCFINFSHVRLHFFNC